jgi:tight adherence protein B
MARIPRSESLLPVADVFSGVFCASAILFASRAIAHRRRTRLMATAGVELASGSTGEPRLSVRSSLTWLVVPGCMLSWLAGGVIAGLPGSVAAAVAMAVAPRIARRRRSARGAEALESDLADAVVVMAATMRSGRSLTQAIAQAGGELNPPLGPALLAVADRSEFGVPFDASLDRLVQELPSADVRLVSGVLRIHRRTGGALPGVLDQVAHTLRERRAAAREIRSLTAQARLSAVILGLLPIGFFLFLSATSKNDIAAAYHSATGATAIGVGLCLQVGAYLWIRRLLQVEV